MRLRSLAFRGITRFTGAQPVTIDFDALGQGLIALTGDNGSGKTTTCEAVPAALFKAFPSRPGSLYDHAHGRDAFIEATFDDAGHELKVRLAIDAENRKTEGYVFEDGRSLTTGRAVEFEAEIGRRFGSQALFLSSAFAAQNKAGSFLLMKRTERKSLFVELLGLAHLEVMATAAREKATLAGRALDRARDAVTAVEVDLAELPGKRGALADATGAADTAAGAVESTRVEEAAAVAQLERAKGAAERMTALSSAETAAARELATSERALAEAKALPGKAASVAAEALRFLSARKADDMAPAAQRRHQAAVNSLEDRRARINAQLADVPDADACRLALQDAQARLQSEVAAGDQAAALGTAAHRAQIEARAAEESLKAANLAHDQRRAMLSRQAGLLTQAPCAAQEDWFSDSSGSADPRVALAGTCPLLEDARQAREKLERHLDSPPDPTPAGEAHQAATTAAALAEASRDAERPNRILTLRQSADALLKDIARADAATHAREQLAALDHERASADATLTVELQAAVDAVAEVGAERLRIEAERIEAVMLADEAIATATHQREEANVRHQLAKDALAAESSGPSVTTAQGRVVAAGETRKQAEARLNHAISARAGLETQVGQLETATATLPALTKSVTTAEREVSDWTLLSAALGKDGVQALEIDAAGPEVQHVVNELLEACYGPRFSISFETLREKKSERGAYSEAFDIRCYDNGAERPVEALSGGEKVVIGEAVGLAIAIFNARKSSVRWETIWRDETAGALDPDNAQQYVAMLRRAREMAGASQVIFVAHQPEVVEAADVRLVVSGGTVSVEGARRAA